MCGKLQNSTSKWPQTIREAAASESCVKNLAPCEQKGQPTPNRQASYSPIICYFIFAEQHEGREPNCESKPSFKKKKSLSSVMAFFSHSFYKIPSPRHILTQPACSWTARIPPLSPPYKWCCVPVANPHRVTEFSPQLDIYSVHAIHCLHIAPRPG